MPERFEIYIVYKRRYINTLPFLYLFIEFLRDAISPLKMKFFRFARTINVGHLHYHVDRHQPVGFRRPVDAYSVCIIRLSATSSQTKFSINYVESLMAKYQQHHPGNMYVRPRNTQTEMYAGRVACCSLMSHVEYAPRALLRLERRRNRQTDGQTDGRTDARPLHYTYCMLNTASVINYRTSP